VNHIIFVYVYLFFNNTKIGPFVINFEVCIFHESDSVALCKQYYLNIKILTNEFFIRLYQKKV